MQSNAWPLHSLFFLPNGCTRHVVIVRREMHSPRHRPNPKANEDTSQERTRLSPASTMPQGTRSLHAQPTTAPISAWSRLVQRTQVASKKSRGHAITDGTVASTCEAARQISHTSSETEPSTKPSVPLSTDPPITGTLQQSSQIPTTSIISEPSTTTRDHSSPPTPITPVKDCIEVCVESEDETCISPPANIHRIESADVEPILSQSDKSRKRRQTSARTQGTVDTNEGQTSSLAAEEAGHRAQGTTTSRLRTQGRSTRQRNMVNSCSIHDGKLQEMQDDAEPGQGPISESNNVAANTTIETVNTAEETHCDTIEASGQYVPNSTNSPPLPNVEAEDVALSPERGEQDPFPAVDEDPNQPARRAKRRLALHSSHDTQSLQKKRKTATKKPSKVQTTLNLAYGNGSGMKECKVCDTLYNPLHPEDIKIHAKRHAGVLRQRAHCMM